jgi:CHASE1-domain containing sensor protein
MGSHGTIKTTGLVLALALFGGCAEMVADTPMNSRAENPGTIVSQRQAAQLVWQYRTQASELRQAAYRYELEAAVQARTVGEDSDAVRRSLQLVKEFSAAADQADELMLQYERQVPHGQMY